MVLNSNIFLAHQKVVLILELEWFPTVSPTEMSRSTYIDAEFHGEFIFGHFRTIRKRLNNLNWKKLKPSFQNFRVSESKFSRFWKF